MFSLASTLTGVRVLLTVFGWGYLPIRQFADARLNSQAMSNEHGIEDNVAKVLLMVFGWGYLPIRQLADARLNGLVM